MRKHSVRKFIHAVLDCLPLMVIPIFAIYSQNHEINDNTLTINESYWETQALYETNTPNNDYSNLTNHYIYKVKFDTQFEEFIDNTGGLYIAYYRYIDNNYDTVFEGSNEYEALLIEYYNGMIHISNDGDTPDVVVATDYLYLVCDGWVDISQDLYSDAVLIYESDYIPSQNIYHENTPVVYNDTDIMSQFMYVTYNAVDKYFNMNRVFNLGNIWNWVQNTLFNGNAPLSAFIVYNVIMYEFIMDIIFLVYLVLMFVIDFAESGIDRFMKRGCR